MNISEFHKILSSTKKKKTILFSIFSVTLITSGAVFNLLIYSDRFDRTVGQLWFPLTAGFFFIFLGIGTFYSLKDKYKVLKIKTPFLQNQNVSIINGICTELSLTPTDTKDNYFLIQHTKGWLNNSFEIQFFAIDNEILLNVDCPGPKEKGVIAFGAGRRMRKRILNRIKLKTEPNSLPKSKC